MKANKDFDIPKRRAAVPGKHIFKPLIPADQVDLKIPAKKLDLNGSDLKHVKAFTELLTSADKTRGDQAGWKGVFFSPTVRKRGLT